MPAQSRLAYNSVLTTVRILEAKGYVDHRQQGRAFLYSPRIAEHDAQQSEVKHVMSRFFGNSREKLMLAVLGNGEVDEAELQMLKELIAEAEAARDRLVTKKEVRP